MTNAFTAAYLIGALSFCGMATASLPDDVRMTLRHSLGLLVTSLLWLPYLAWLAFRLSQVR